MKSMLLIRRNNNNLIIVLRKFFPLAFVIRIFVLPLVYKIYMYI